MSGSEPPLISFIIPVFNGAMFLSETLNSLLKQTSQNWEAIVIDDGSTDKTWRILEEATKKNERLRIYKRAREPKGASTCRNIGVKLSLGDYIVFLDSDDLIGEDFVTSREHFIEKFPKKDFMVFPMKSFVKNPDKDSYVSFTLFSEKSDIQRFFRLDPPFINTGPLWRKTSFLKTGGFNEALQSYQDWELHLRTLLDNPKYIKIDLNEADVFYRKQSKYATISNTFRPHIYFDTHIKMLKSIDESIQSVETSISCKKEYSIYYKGYFLKAATFLARKNEVTYAIAILRALKENSYFDKLDYLLWNLYVRAASMKDSHKITERIVNSLIYRLFPKKNYVYLLLK